MKKKIVLPFLLSFLVAGISHAQVSIGVHGNAILSNLTFKYDESGISYDNVYKSKASFMGGVQANVPFGKSIAILPQLNVVLGGAKIDGNADSDFGFSSSCPASVPRAASLKRCLMNFRLMVRICRPAKKLS